MSYEAIVTKISISPHPNADRLQIGRCLNGIQVVVGLDTKDGEIGVFFGPDGCLSKDMLMNNDLIQRKNPVTGKHEGGYFAENGRVRAQKFRGVESDGFWLPLSSLGWTGHDLSSLKEGDTFSSLNSHQICEKYVTPATKRAQGSRGGGIVKHFHHFPEHFDTPQLCRIAAMIPTGSLVYITSKQHGTSHRLGHVPVKTPLPIWKRAINWVSPFFPKETYTILHGSRRRVINEDSGYDKYRFNALRGVIPRNGECIYMEICGYDEKGNPIMHDHHIKDENLFPNDQHGSRQYGARMRYAYGTDPGQSRAFVYRITQMTPDKSYTMELTWNQMVGRCRDLGLETVPLLMGPIVYDGHVENLIDLATKYANGEEITDPSHIREGVVLRIEHPDRIGLAKHKSWIFLHLEGLLKDTDIIDKEEAS